METDQNTLLQSNFGFALTEFDRLSLPNLFFSTSTHKHPLLILQSPRSVQLASFERAHGESNGSLRRDRAGGTEKLEAYFFRRRTTPLAVEGRRDCGAAPEIVDLLA